MAKSSETGGGFSFCGRLTSPVFGADAKNVSTSDYNTSNCTRINAAVFYSLSVFFYFFCIFFTI